MDRLFVIIVTYNGAYWISRCINSVYRSSIPTIPIVVDNGSSDKTLDIINKEFPQSIIIKTGRNLGFGQANNIGIRRAIQEGAKYIYLLNQDAWVDENVFERLIEVKKNNPEYGILSPLQLAADRKTLDKNFINDTIVRFSDCHTLLNNMLTSSVKQVYETKFVMAAHWFIDVDDIKRIGLFSPAFPHYGEDNNLIDRFHYFGYKIGFCPNLFAVHDRQYRVINQKDKMYWQFKGLLMVWNNPMCNSNIKRLKRLIGFVTRVLLIQNVPIKDKLSIIYKGLRLLPISKKCRGISKTEGAFLS